MAKCQNEDFENEMAEGRTKYCSDTARSKPIALERCFGLPARLGNGHSARQSRKSVLEKCQPAPEFWMISSHKIVRESLYFPPFTLSFETLP